MNEQELRDFMVSRKPSAVRFDLSGLHCYGCAHSSSMEPPPGKPSGERPCCSCVRNIERELWKDEAELESPAGDSIVIGDDGHARIFDPYVGTLYNGAPRINFPSDNYVTLDKIAQDDWMDEHPEYKKPIRYGSDGKLHVIENGD